MINEKVLIYQKFQEQHEPIPPFVGTVLADYLNRWGIRYQLLDGTYITRRINKACVSTKPIKEYIERIGTKKPRKGVPKAKIERFKIKPKVPINVYD